MVTMAFHVALQSICMAYAAQKCIYENGRIPQLVTTGYNSTQGTLMFSVIYMLKKRWSNSRIIPVQSRGLLLGRPRETASLTRSP